MFRFQLPSPITAAYAARHSHTHCVFLVTYTVGYTPKFSVSTYVELLYMLCILSVVHNMYIRIYVDRIPLLYDPVQAYHPSCCPSLSCNASLCRAMVVWVHEQVHMLLSLHVRMYVLLMYYIDSKIYRTFCGTAHQIQPLYDSALLGNATHHNK